MIDDMINILGSIDFESGQGKEKASKASSPARETGILPGSSDNTVTVSKPRSKINTSDNVNFSQELMDEKRERFNTSATNQHDIRKTRENNSQRTDESQQKGYGAKKMKFAKIENEDAETKSMLETAAKASKGDKDATLQNIKNIMDRTREPFTQNFTERYQEDNNGKEPSKDEVTKAHNEEFLKSFTYERYGFNQAAGIEPGKIDPAFSDPLVKNMMISFPNRIDLKNPDGSQVKGINLNHVLSGVQFNGTSPDSAMSAAQKYSVGQGVNSHLAEALKPTGIYGEEHKRGEEPGHSGIWAGSSKNLVNEFLKDPVKGMEKFLNNPSVYINDSKDPKTILLTPLTSEIKQMLKMASPGDLSA